MGLLSRIRHRIDRRLHPTPSGVGTVLTPALEKEWDELPEQVDAYLKKVGSAVVSSWEVGAAELGRVVLRFPENQKLIDRYSDALVPTLAPYQDLHKRCSSQMAAARNVAKKQGIPAAVPEMLELFRGLGPKAAEGWVKTVEYLEPLITLCQDPVKTRAEMLRLGPELSESAVRSEAALKAQLVALPAAPTLYDGVCDAFETYQLAISRDLEIGLDRVARALVTGLKR